MTAFAGIVALPTPFPCSVCGSRKQVHHCPKCGRRGALGIGHMKHATWSAVYHFSYLQLGFNVWPVEGQCSISLHGPVYPEKISSQREKAASA